MDTKATAQLLNKSDKLVSGEGLTCRFEVGSEKELISAFSIFMYYLSATVRPVEEYFGEFLYLYENDFDLYEKKLIEQEKLYSDLIDKSSLNGLLFSYDLSITFRRIAKICSKTPIGFFLNKYDFVPETFKDYQNDIRFLYLIYWKREMYERYKVILALKNGASPDQGIYFPTYLARLYWQINDRELTRLVKLLRRYFERDLEVDEIVKILRRKSYGNIVWRAKTEELAYLFKLLADKGIISKFKWRVGLCKGKVFCSKQGTVINDFIINTSLNRLKNKGFHQRSLKFIDKIVDRFLELTPIGINRKVVK
ncbi:hypothetical protein GO730_26180 [Spirosoma sp. HMF3257]|uniref:Uncharacterized protein n=1 Tax=Spirosoma telluris TaxID=2183553 RepID=A0A327NNJ2_9BACT|nr:hypothetical protein [Spirosoma telluris]RAI76777.1 hypothetical protein HMF3257_26110 [Spirosoma telluris]